VRLHTVLAGILLLVLSLVASTNLGMENLMNNGATAAFQPPAIPPGR
jgi:hypothetical protein